VKVQPLPEVTPVIEADITGTETPIAVG
jgi:hypothetical protein